MPSEPDPFGGLPHHPLVVHAAVVLIPLAALAVIALVLVRRWRERYAALTLVALVLATVAAWVARLSGGILDETLGTAGDHRDWGERLPLAMTAFLVIGAAWLGSGMRRHWLPRPGRGGALLAGAIVVLAAAAILVLVVVTGHSGAKITWGPRVR